MVRIVGTSGGGVGFCLGEGWVGWGRGHTGFSGETDGC